jgi:tetratricopeptide (TPR) repeat protein
MHFRRGVQLYGEADYAGALAEFKRAYSISPTAAALYNVGEAQYQLQDYAGALKTFRRFLADFAPNESHRADVDSAVEILRGRVGHLNVVTVPLGADVSVDDQPAGKTPLDQRLLVSVGRRRVTAVLPGRAPLTRVVDVAAGDDVSVSLELPPVGPEMAPPMPVQDHRSTADVKTSRPKSTLRTIGWIFTGAFAAGAAGAGALALRESSQLKAARNAFPASSGTLQQESDRTRAYCILADSLGIAALAVGGVTLWSTLAPGTARSSEGSARLRVGPSSVSFDASF